MYADQLHINTGPRGFKCWLRKSCGYFVFVNIKVSVFDSLSKYLGSIPRRKKLCTDGIQHFFPLSILMYIPFLFFIVAPMLLMRSFSSDSLAENTHCRNE